MRHKPGTKRLVIEPGTHPLVRLVFQAMETQSVTHRKLEDEAGLGRGTVSYWSTNRNNPRLMNIEAALNYLGYELVALRGPSLAPETKARGDEHLPGIMKLRTEVAALQARRRASTNANEVAAIQRMIQRRHNAIYRLRLAGGISKKG